jgi:PBSX family phage terminase large subunit
MEITDKQIKSIKQAACRQNIWEGSVRSGKTYASILRWNQFVRMESKGQLIMVGKTLDTLKRNILIPMSEIFGSSLKYSADAKTIRLGEKLIHGIGANDEKAETKIRGMSLGGAYTDEITLYPESFYIMLLSRLSMAGAKLIGTTNTDSPYHWLKKNYIDRQKELDMSVFSFRLEDNPFLPKDYIASLKKEYTGLWYNRFILGQWVLAEGIIYDMWNEKTHTVDIPADKKFQSYIVGVDYGTNNPCTFGLIGFDTPENVFLVSEYYYDSVKRGRQKTDEEYARDFKYWLKGIIPMAVYVDPSALSFITTLKRDGYKVRDADNDVLAGIRFVSGMLEAGRLKVNRACRNTIEEFASYVWDARAQAHGEDKPLKKHDHCLDMLRYALYTNFSRNPIISGSRIITSREGY